MKVKVKVKVKVTEYNIRNDPIRWQISTSTEVILDHFTRYSRFKIRVLENVGQGHDVQEVPVKCKQE